jgi:hypothetical protein
MRRKQRHNAAQAAPTYAPQPGDIVFFTHDHPVLPVSHVGIYLGYGYDERLKAKGHLYAHANATKKKADPGVRISILQPKNHTQYAFFTITHSQWREKIIYYATTWARLHKINYASERKKQAEAIAKARLKRYPDLHNRPEVLATRALQEIALTPASEDNLDARWRLMKWHLRRNQPARPQTLNGPGKGMLCHHFVTLILQITAIETFYERPITANQQNLWPSSKHPERYGHEHPSNLSYACNQLLHEEIIQAIPDPLQVDAKHCHPMMLLQALSQMTEPPGPGGAGFHAISNPWVINQGSLSHIATPSKDTYLAHLVNNPAHARHVVTPVTLRKKPKAAKRRFTLLRSRERTGPQWIRIQQYTNRLMERLINNMFEQTLSAAMPLIQRASRRGRTQAVLLNRYHSPLSSEDRQLRTFIAQMTRTLGLREYAREKTARKARVRAVRSTQIAPRRLTFSGKPPVQRVTSTAPRIRIARR